MTLQLGMIATLIVAITIAANAAAAFGDLVGARSVLANSAEVGVPRTWVPMLGLLKGAGAVGLLVGLFGFPPFGIAAAIGLIAFFIGAVITHVRAQVFYNIAFPAAFLVLAVLSLGAFVAG
ncbi:DoxX family protein [Mycobacterium sp. 134]|uniref:DoxX family protein n=1 Tax=Mycobacterium sp. 134 TaxID=3400425 RepID=UPI003AAC439E